jgi:hypothetical protein
MSDSTSFNGSGLSTEFIAWLLEEMSKTPRCQEFVRRLGDALSRTRSAEDWTQTNYRVCAAISKEATRHADHPYVSTFCAAIARALDAADAAAANALLNRLSPPATLSDASTHALAAATAAAKGMMPAAASRAAHASAVEALLSTREKMSLAEAEVWPKAAQQWIAGWQAAAERIIVGALDAFELSL